MMPVATKSGSWNAWSGQRVGIWDAGEGLHQPSTLLLPACQLQPLVGFRRSSTAV